MLLSNFLPVLCTTWSSSFKWKIQIWEFRMTFSSLNATWPLLSLIAGILYVNQIDRNYPQFEQIVRLLTYTYDTYCSMSAEHLAQTISMNSTENWAAKAVRNMFFSTIAFWFEIMWANSPKLSRSPAYKNPLLFLYWRSITFGIRISVRTFLM